MTDERYYAEYFRVAFYGNFPVAMRTKQFIVRIEIPLPSPFFVTSNLSYQYRGFEWEKLAAFCERMLNKHPGAQLLRTPGEAPVDIRFGTDQYIQCTSVVPEPDHSLPIFSNLDVPLAVKSYYEHRSVFSFLMRFGIR